MATKRLQVIEERRKKREAHLVVGKALYANMEDDQLVAGVEVHTT